MAQHVYSVFCGPLHEIVKIDSKQAVQVAAEAMLQHEKRKDVSKRYGDWVSVVSDFGQRWLLDVNEVERFVSLIRTKCQSAS